VSDHWVVGGQVGAAVLCCGCFTTRAQFFAAAAGPAFTAFLLTQVSTERRHHTNSHIPSGTWLSGGAHRQLESPPTDNCPQPKEAQALSQLDIRSIQDFDSSALWSDGPEEALYWPFPYPILPARSTTMVMLHQLLVHPTAPFLFFR
jgi:hypothetical protein